MGGDPFEGDEYIFGCDIPVEKQLKAIYKFRNLCSRPSAIQYAEKSEIPVFSLPKVKPVCVQRE